MQAPEHNGDNNVNISMPFGKYRGKIVNDVMEKDPSYLVWFVRNIEICLTSLRRSKAIATFRMLGPLI